MGLSLLDDVLKSIYSSEIDIKLINSDDIRRHSHNIGDEILHIRLGQDGNKPYNGSIIVYGFDSFDNLIRREKHQNHLLLVSPGVYYLKIPCDINIVQTTLDKANKFAISPEQLHESLKGHLVDNRARRVESVWAHKLGNFFGSEKLLYGAYLAGAIEKWHYFCSSLEVIRNDQKKYLHDLTSDQEFSIYYFAESMNFSPVTEDRPILPPLSGKILYIDDHAHLGWANAITIALGGPILSTENQHRDNIWFEKKVNMNQSIEVWSFYPQKTETLFLDQINKFIKYENLNYFDAIILDLRLQSVNDEKEMNVDEISGNKVLKSIRKVNPLIPVLMLTASRKARNMQRIFNLGADGYFIKETTEENRSSDGTEEVIKYYKEFREIMEWTLSKSYLSAAWPVIKDIEETITDEERTYLRKSIALLKKRPFEFEKDVLLFSVIDEAILNLNMIKEMRQKTIKNSLDAGYLIGALRNFAAHSEIDNVTENDAKICLYLLFRILTNNNNLLEPFVRKVFGDIRILSLEYVLNETYSRIAKAIAESYIDQIFKHEREFIPNKDEYNTYQYIKEKREIRYHYLLFLCRLMHDYNNKISKNILKSDEMIISYVYNKIASFEADEVPEYYFGKLKGTQTNGFRNIYIEVLDKHIRIAWKGLDKSWQDKLKKKNEIQIKFAFKLDLNGPTIDKMEHA